MAGYTHARLGPMVAFANRSFISDNVWMFPVGL